MDNFCTIDRTSSTEYNERGSKFIAEVFPITTADEFKNQLRIVKKNHPKAAHHCFAYRLGTDQYVFRSNDDGEPSGTAGKQILGEIDSRNLTDILLIVSRYFGGTLLGIPGLIKAYKTSASLVLQTVPVIIKQVESNALIHFPSESVNEIMSAIKLNNCTILDKELNMFPWIKARVPNNKRNEFIEKLPRFAEVTWDKKN